MKTLFIVQSNFGKGHHARVNAFGDAVDSRLIITKHFNGQGKDTEFFGDTWNDLLFDYLEYDPDILITEGFPFGRYAEQAQIEIVYAYYRNDDMEAARAAADRFIRLHPDSENIDYAYYMKGLSSFTDGGGIFNRFLPIDHTKRDPGSAQESFTDFAQLLALYPDSAYAGDARARMIYLRNNLARYEIHVAEYYTERRAYIAALRRAQYVVENFQGTPAVADGMAIMVECYLRLGLNELADTSLALLKENYPQHASIDSDGDFIIRTEITNPSLLYTVTFGLVGDNAVDPPLAPTQRPLTSGSQQIIDAQQDIEVEGEGRSFFDIITLGIFN